METSKGGWYHYQPGPRYTDDESRDILGPIGRFEIGDLIPLLCLDYSKFTHNGTLLSKDGWYFEIEMFARCINM